MFFKRKYFKIMKHYKESFNYLIIYGSKSEVKKALMPLYQYREAFSVKTFYSLTNIISKILDALDNMDIIISPSEVEIPKNVIMTEEDWAYIHLENVKLSDLLQALQSIESDLKTFKLFNLVLS